MNNLIDKIVCGDVLEVTKKLPNESVDLIVADPPYNSSIAEWDMKDDEWQVSWLQETKRVLKVGGSIYVFFAPLNMLGVEQFIRSNFTLKNLLIWFHPNLYGAFQSYGKDRWKSTYEVIFYATKGQKSSTGIDIQQEAWKRWRRSFDVLQIPSEIVHKLHKVQKPLSLVERFVLMSSNVGDLVLDLFSGSGTTSVVCKRWKRHFIGVEKERSFVEIGNNRLNREYAVVENFW